MYLGYKLDKERAHRGC